MKDNIVSFTDQYCSCVGWHCRSSITISLAKTIFVWHNLFVVTSCGQQCKKSIVAWNNASLLFPHSQQFCGVWSPLESGGNCQQDLHALLGDVQTLCFCCHFCIQQSWLSWGATMLMLLPTMRTQKSLTGAFVAMAVAERPALLQALWHFFHDEGSWLVRSTFLCALWRLFQLLKV